MTLYHASMSTANHCFSVCICSFRRKQCSMSNKDLSSKPITTNAQLLLTNGQQIAVQAPMTFRRGCRRKQIEKYKDIPTER